MMMHNAVDNLQGGTLQGQCGHMRQGRKGWSTEAYYNLAVLAKQLHSSDYTDVNIVLDVCSELSLPPEVAEGVAMNRDGKAVAPRSSSHVFFALCLMDIAFILFWRDLHRNNDFLYFWMADSSPISGYDWLNVSFTYVSANIATVFCNMVWR